MNDHTPIIRPIVILDSHGARAVGEYADPVEWFEDGSPAAYRVQFSDPGGYPQPGQPADGHVYEAHRVSEYNGL